MIWNWWVFAVVPVAWILQNCIHEFSHMIVGWVTRGEKPAGFYPYPHRRAGIFYFARYSYSVSDSKNSHAPKWIAPFWGGVVWFVIAGILMLLLSREMRIFVVPFTVAAVVDALFFWRGYFWGTERCDGKRWEKVRKEKENVR